MAETPEPNNSDDPGRGTGRTTALMLQAIAQALLWPDQWQEFRDHAEPAGMTLAQTAAATGGLRAKAKALGLTLDIEVGKGVVNVRSPMARLRNRR